MAFAPGEQSVWHSRDSSPGASGMDLRDDIVDEEPPLHPLPAMQGAFEESMMETLLEIEQPESPNRNSTDNSVIRRRQLLEQDQYERTVAGRWKQKPGEKYHPLVKLVAQISFGMHLLHLGLAKSDDDVITILQTHVDEVDGFLERTTDDFELAQEDIDDRLRYLKIPLEHGEVFDNMLNDRAFRTAIVDGNEKIEHIVDRTAVAMKDALKDVQKGLDSTRELAKYLAQLGGIWIFPSEVHAQVYVEMVQNTEGWSGAFVILQQKGSSLSQSLVELEDIISDLQRWAGVASRRNPAIFQPAAMSPRSQYSADPRAASSRRSTSPPNSPRKPLPSAPRTSGEVSRRPSQDKYMPMIQEAAPSPKPTIEQRTYPRAMSIGTIPSPAVNITPKEPTLAEAVPWTVSMGARKSPMPKETKSQKQSSKESSKEPSLAQAVPWTVSMGARTPREKSPSRKEPRIQKDVSLTEAAPWTVSQGARKPHEESPIIQEEKPVASAIPRRRSLSERTRSLTRRISSYIESESADQLGPLPTLDARSDRHTPRSASISNARSDSWGLMSPRDQYDHGGNLFSPTSSKPIVSPYDLDEILPDPDTSFSPLDYPASSPLKSSTEEYYGTASATGGLPSSHKPSSQPLEKEILAREIRFATASPTSTLKPVLKDLPLRNFRSEGNLGGFIRDFDNLPIGPIIRMKSNSARKTPTTSGDSSLYSADGLPTGPSSAGPLSTFPKLEGITQSSSVYSPEGTASSQYQVSPFNPFSPPPGTSSAVPSPLRLSSIGNSYTGPRTAPLPPKRPIRPPSPQQQQPPPAEPTRPTTPLETLTSATVTGPEPDIYPYIPSPGPSPRQSTHSIHSEAVEHIATSSIPMHMNPGYSSDYHRHLEPASPPPPSPGWSPSAPRKLSEASAVAKEKGPKSPWKKVFGSVTGSHRRSKTKSEQLELDLSAVGLTPDKRQRRSEDRKFVGLGKDGQWIQRTISRKGSKA